MSSSKKLIINCGASRVTAAVIGQDSGGLELDELVTISLDYDYSNDEAWLDAVKSALSDLARQHKMSGKASIIIPGNQVLTKNIRIPHVEPSKRSQILAFEAQQSIPYPLHEVVWDSQVIDDDGVETEVLFIACKSNTIDEITASISSAGFTPETISAATLLEYNAIQFAQPDLDEEILLINIGARSTNLIFTKNEKGFFARNIQLGSNTLTQNIADSLGKSFEQAEEVKRRFFAGELDYTDDDSGAKLLQGCADSFLRRMNQEITRSIVNYRRQKNGAAPKRILLSGRGSLLRGLDEQLSEKQKIPVEFFDPLQNVTLGSKVSSPSKELGLEISEIIGEACRDLVADGAGVNLLPQEIQDEIAFRRKKPILIVAAIFLALAPWPALQGFTAMKEAYSEKADELKNKAAPLEVRQEEILETKEKALAVGESIQQVEDLVNSKINWIQFFGTLQQSLMQTEDVWLDGLGVERELSETGEQKSFEIVLKGRMLVRDASSGEGFNRELLTQRIKQLQASFETSEFIDTSRPPNVNWNSLHSGLNVLPFTINLVVDTSKTL